MFLGCAVALCTMQNALLVITYVVTLLDLAHETKLRAPLVVGISWAYRYLSF